MGSTRSTRKEDARAYVLGQFIAQQGWVTMTGGGSTGIMNQALRGAKDGDGLTMAILWGGRNTGNTYSSHIDIPVYTKMSSGRNYINALTSDVLVVATGLTPGTLSETVMAIVEQRPVILLGGSPSDQKFLKKKGGALVHMVKTPEKAIEKIKKIIA